MNELLHNDQKHEKRHGVSNRDDTLWIAFRSSIKNTGRWEVLTPLYLSQRWNQLWNNHRSIQHLEWHRDAKRNTRIYSNFIKNKSIKGKLRSTNLVEMCRWKPYRKQSHKKDNIMWETCQCGKKVWRNHKWSSPANLKQFVLHKVLCNLGCHRLLQGKTGRKISSDLHWLAKIEKWERGEGVLSCSAMQLALWLSLLLILHTG